jgi:hypothetical protein
MDTKISEKKFDSYTDHNFEQSISIENIDCKLVTEFIEITKDTLQPKYKISIDGNGVSYNCIVLESEKIQKIKNAVKKNHGLSYDIKYIEGGLNLNFTITHPILSGLDRFTFTKDKIEPYKLFSDRIKLLEESMINKKYPITPELLGQCAVYDKDALSPANLQKTIKEYFDTLNKPGSKNGNYTSGSYPDQKYKFLQNIEKIYKINYLYQDEQPTPTKNQALFSGIVYVEYVEGQYGSISNRLSHYDYPNSWTLLTLKYQSDGDFNIIGYVENKKDSITIDFPKNLSLNFLNQPRVKSESGTNYCSHEDYIKYCNIIKLPFNVKNGIYKGTMDYHDKSIHRNVFYLIKDNNLFWFSNVLDYNPDKIYLVAYKDYIRTITINI